MVVSPLVDDVHRLPIVEIATLRLSVVEVVSFLHKPVLQIVTLACVHEDGVGDECFRRGVKAVGLGQHLPAEGIDGVGTCLPESQRLIDLLLGLSCRSVVQHAQGVGDAQGRDHAALLPASLTEQIEGKVVISSYQLPSTVRQFYLLGSIEGRSIKPEVSPLDVGQLLVVADAGGHIFEKIMYKSFILETYTLYANGYIVCLAAGVNMLVTMSAEQLTVLLYGFVNTSEFRQILSIVLQCEVDDQEVLLVTLIVVHIHSPLFVLAEGSEVIFLELLLVRPVHLHILTSVDDRVTI